MSDRHDYLALDWVRGEIQETLNQAQQALESFVDNPDDATRMRFCQTHLHQVYGTLQMVEFTVRHCSPKKWKNWRRHCSTAM